jgi:hypothetical protein
LYEWYNSKIEQWKIVIKITMNFVKTSVLHKVAEVKKV